MDSRSELRGAIAVNLLALALTVDARTRTSAVKAHSRSFSVNGKGASADKNPFGRLWHETLDRPASVHEML